MPLPRPARLALWSVLLAAGLLAACGSDTPRDSVHILTADGAIGPVIANYIDRGLDDAEEASARAAVIRLDTPGGLDSSMREIIQRMNQASVPVVVYVAPAGGRAASAGTFITMAADIAAMAPNTAIGAAHPVSATGGDIEDDLGTKVENDAAAYIRSIAQAHGRNADWAERAVRESVSASATEAVDLGVVDLQAAGLAELLDAIDGREVTLGDGSTVALQTADAPVHENGMSFSERVLMVLSDPNIAFLLLSIGSIALILELLNPSGIGAAVGVLALVVAFFSLGTLPVNWAGVALVMLGAGLLAAEIFIVTGGIAGVAGVVVMALGGLFLTTSNRPEFEVSRWLAVGLPATVGLAFAGVLALLWQARRRTPQFGPGALVGHVAIARTEVTDHDGAVIVRGERWHARLDPTAPRPIAPGEGARITGIDGMQLTVHPTPGDDAPPPAPSHLAGEGGRGGVAPTEH